MCTYNRKEWVDTMTINHSICTYNTSLWIFTIRSGYLQIIIVYIFTNREISQDSYVCSEQ